MFQGVQEDEWGTAREKAIGAGLEDGRWIVGSLNGGMDGELKVDRVTVCARLQIFDSGEVGRY